MGAQGTPDPKLGPSKGLGHGSEGGRGPAGKRDKKRITVLERCLTQGPRTQEASLDLTMGGLGRTQPRIARRIRKRRPDNNLGLWGGIKQK